MKDAEWQAYLAKGPPLAEMHSTLLMPTNYSPLKYEQRLPRATVAGLEEQEASCCIPHPPCGLGMRMCVRGRTHGFRSTTPNSR